MDFTTTGISLLRAVSIVTGAILVSTCHGANAREWPLALFRFAETLSNAMHFSARDVDLSKRRRHE